MDKQILQKYIEERVELKAKMTGLKRDYNFNFEQVKVLMNQRQQLIDETDKTLDRLQEIADYFLELETDYLIANNL